MGSINCRMHWRVMKHAIRIKPDYADAYFNMGSVYREQGLLQDALDSYKHATRINPDYAEAYLNMGNVYREQGLLQDALESYKHAIRIKTDYAECLPKYG